MRAFKYGFLQKTVLWGTDFGNRWLLNKSYALKVWEKKICLFDFVFRKFLFIESYRCEMNKIQSFTIENSQPTLSQF